MSTLHQLGFSCVQLGLWHPGGGCASPARNHSWPICADGSAATWLGTSHQATPERRW